MPAFQRKRYEEDRRTERADLHGRHESQQKTGEAVRRKTVRREGREGQNTEHAAGTEEGLREAAQRLRRDGSREQNWNGLSKLFTTRLGQHLVSESFS